MVGGGPEDVEALLDALVVAAAALLVELLLLEELLLAVPVVAVAAPPPHAVTTPAAASVAESCKNRRRLSLFDSTRSPSVELPFHRIPAKPPTCDTNLDAVHQSGE